MYIQRTIEQSINKIAQTFKVLYVGGPRQVGKTTTLRRLARSKEMNYVTLDDVSSRQLAQQDPDLFLQQFPAPLLIDEVQYAPELFSAIKIRVDQHQQNGQYWLTGSQHFSALRHVQESLAGRVGIIYLLGLALSEIHSTPPTSHSDPFLPGHYPHSAPTLTIHDVFSAILQGSYPALWQSVAPERETFYNSYIQTYIDRDLRELYGIEKTPEFHHFLQLCAARTGQLLNYSDLARDAGISLHAAKEWIDILQSTMHIFLLQPYHRNISKRAIKTPKLYLLDTGLAAHLTKWNSVETLQAGAMAGAFFETCVVSELVKSYLFRGKQPPLYFFRDKEGHEVDVLIEQEQQLYPIEIKLRSTPTANDAAGIEYLRKQEKQLQQGAIVCLAPQRIPFNRSIDIVPLSLIR